MALLVTSCTMGKNPNRLLDKGPSYLRTRTNSKLFAGRRRSAVELLEASRPQYVKSDEVLGHSRPVSLHFPDSFNVFGRSPGSVTNTQPSRSKSEYNLSDLQVDDDDDVDGIKPIAVEDSHMQQQQHNLIACRRTRRKTIEALPITINMSEAGHKTDSSQESKPQCIDCTSDNLRAPVSVDPNLSVSCQNLGEMAADKPADKTTEKITGSGDPVETASDTEKTCTPVHRSHSDLNCRRARDSSVTSDRSGRYSRASADLENFFNQMGLERNVLDPMLRLQETHGKREFDMFESVSSLDSPDTRSICSGISRSEKGVSDTEAGDKHSTSVVERNARIIKWLCSVKKAKTNFPGHS